MATAGPRIPTSGTNTEGNQAAANSPVMARATYNRRYCTESTRSALVCAAGGDIKVQPSAHASFPCRCAGCRTAERRLAVGPSPGALGAQPRHPHRGGPQPGPDRPGAERRRQPAAAGMPGAARPPARAGTQVAGPLSGPAQLATATLGVCLPGMGPGAAGGINSAACSPASLLAALEALFRGDGSSRLQAIEAAHRWGDRRCLPLLRRGLRDPDPAVMRTAAVAIERFRGRPCAPAAQSRPQGSAAPRKVSRTR